MKEYRPTFYTGIIEANNDPLRIGRVRVRVLGVHHPEVSEQPTEDLPWAHVVQIGGAGSGLGFHSVPEIGTWVLCGFLDEDTVQQPVVLGCLNTIHAGSGGGGSNVDADGNPLSGGTAQEETTDNAAPYEVKSGDIVSCKSPKGGNLPDSLIKACNVIGHGLNVPPIVILTQVALESDWGQSKLAKYNNFAGYRGGGSGKIQTSGNGTFATFKSPEEFAQAYIKNMKQKWPKCVGQQDASEYYKIIQNKENNYDYSGKHGYMYCTSPAGMTYVNGLLKQLKTMESRVKYAT